jgi:citrate lyase subunit beta/citryl-CoA lyase
MDRDTEARALLLTVAEARSWLFVPGDRRDRFGNAATSGADLVICDLEDAVATDRKTAARTEVVRWLQEGGVACVRINAHGTPHYDADVAALAGLPGLRAVMVPKAEDSRAVTELSETVGPHTPVVPLVETALGVHRAYDLAGAQGVVRLAFGSLDFALDIGATETAATLLFARTSLVVASRAARVAAPLDGVTRAFDDPLVIEADAAAAAGLGFGGKLCIHPRQVAAVNGAFSPSEEDVRRARRLLDSVSDGSAGRLDGEMVDRPVVERARQVLRQAGGEPRPGPARRS